LGNNSKITFKDIKLKSKLIQILSEIWFGLFFFILQVIFGIFYRIPNYTKGSKRPVVLLCGWLERPICWFPMRKKLIEAGHPVYIVPLGFQVGDIKKKAVIVSRFLKANNINDCYLVCHSMGGLIGWGMIHMSGTRVRKMYTLGTPLRGTYMAYLAPFFPSTWQMMPGSNFLELLGMKYNVISKVQSINASFDQIVVPTKYSQLNHKDDVLLPETGHMNLFMGSTGIKYILELIELDEDEQYL